MKAAALTLLGCGVLLFGLLALAAVTAPDGDSAQRIDLRGRGFQLKQIETEVGLIASYEAGAGQALVFLHGIYGGASAFTSWRKIAPAFIYRARVIAPDLIGWGGSTHPTHLLSQQDYERAIRDILVYAGAPDRKPIVVAESLTAGFLASVINQDPSLASRIILLAPSGARDFGVDQFKPEIRYSLGLLANVPGLRSLTYRALFHRRSLFQNFWEGPSGYANAAAVESDIIEASWWSATRPGAEWSALPFLSGDLRYDIAPILQAISTPATAIWPSKDEFLTPETLTRLKNLNRGIEAVTIKVGQGGFTATRAQEIVAAVARKLD